jgi:23S rRNA-/tRNA-specific pseudouridylate synthase
MQRHAQTLARILHPRARIVGISGSVIAVEKPHNVLCHPNTNDKELQTRSKHKPLLGLGTHYDFDSESFSLDEGPLFLLHRLDLGTSGVLLLASDEKEAQHVKKMFRMRRVEKTYSARVFTPLDPPVAGQVWVDTLTLGRNGADRNVRAETLVEAVSLSADSKTAVLRLKPKTGYTHQLRIQAAKRNMPIVGDEIHGDWIRNSTLSKRRLLLHASTISYLPLSSNSRVTFSSPVPDLLLV